MVIRRTCEGMSAISHHVELFMLTPNTSLHKTLLQLLCNRARRSVPLTALPCCCGDVRAGCQEEDPYHHHGSQIITGPKQLQLLRVDILSKGAESVDERRNIIDNQLNVTQNGSVPLSAPVPTVLPSSSPVIW
uniref:Uncharacterized protein n=1 Tax=Knipowitschia caucasica TaxID=637954 RepID=A0AAV2KAZ3_KNICA